MPIKIADKITNRYFLINITPLFDNNMFI